MNQTMGNFLLVLGVVLGALAAAESKRAYRTLPLEAGLAHPDQFLYGDVLVPEPQPEGAEPRAIPAQIEIAKADAPLDTALVERLRGAGFEEVRVRFPAITAETVAVGEAALGRVLAEPVLLRNETQELKQGRLIDDNLREIADAVGVTLPVKVEERGEEETDGQLEVEPVERLSEPIELPVRLRVDEYVNAAVLERLQAAELSEISVRIPPEFDWKGWRYRYTFIAAVVLTLLGVLFKRVRPAGVEEEQNEEMAAWVAHFNLLDRGVRELAARARELDAKELHAALDPLLSGPAYAFLEGRETVRAAHGGKAYARVMGPYAGLERRLHRAWSAAVDGVAEEARDSLEAALPYLDDTRAALPGNARVG